MILRPPHYALSLARECRRKAQSCMVEATRRRYEMLAADYERLGRLHTAG
jgi:hypothetical protein